MLRAVLLDVDFTLFRPGPELGPEGYARAGERHGLELDPARYDTARLAALDDLEHHPELVHDVEVWVRFTLDVVTGMGGAGERAVACARAITAEWERHDNFHAYDDARPALEALRAHGLRLGLISNGQRDLEAFVRHHDLDVDVAVGSLSHGFVKPHRSIFEAALAALETPPTDAAMVGDSMSDDIEGAQALGLQTVLVDRDGRHPEWEGAIRSLVELPAALGL